MSEPTTVASILKWGSAGIASGVAVAAAAVEASPDIALAVTPSLEKSIYLLAVGIVLAAGKHYLPSEKKVDLQFDKTQAGMEELKSGHKTLTDKIIDLVDGTDKERNERREHYNMLYRWMGETDQKFVAINDRVAHIDGVLTRHIERGQKDSGEIRRPS